MTLLSGMYPGGRGGGGGSGGGCSLDVSLLRLAVEDVGRVLDSDEISMSLCSYPISQSAKATVSEGIVQPFKEPVTRQRRKCIG